MMYLHRSLVIVIIRQHKFSPVINYFVFSHNKQSFGCSALLVSQCLVTV